MKIITSILFLLLGVLFSNAQTSTMTTSSNWSDASAWSNGIPTATTYAEIRGGFLNRITLTVDTDAVCDSLSLFFASIDVNPNVTLIINGGYSATTIGNNQNNGTLIVKKSLTPAVGSGGLNIGGSVTIVGGLTFEDFKID